jgi:hypothetical protein
MSIAVFESQEFAPTSSAAPFAQILNPRFSGGAVGFSITEKNAIAGGLNLPPTWEKVNHKFGGGDIEPVYVTKSPRLLILGGSALIMRDRKTRKAIGKFSSNVYNKTEHSLYRKVWAYILNDENGFCHLDPIAIAIGGASGASFMATWFKAKPRSGFIDRMETLYAEAVKKPKASKGELFHAHCVYEPTMNVEIRGTGNTSSEVCVTTGYKDPTIKRNLIVDEVQRSVITDAFKTVKLLAVDFENRALNNYAGDEMAEDQPF